MKFQSINILIYFRIKKDESKFIARWNSERESVLKYYQKKMETTNGPKHGDNYTTLSKSKRRNFIFFSQYEEINTKTFKISKQIKQLDNLNQATGYVTRMK